MTSKDIIAAMRSKAPVVYDGATYIRILAYIFWINDFGEECRSVELLDKNGGTRVRVRADKVTLADLTEKGWGV